MTVMGNSPDEDRNQPLKGSLVCLPQQLQAMRLKIWQ
jgi:hypothetical protein